MTSIKSKYAEGDDCADKKEIEAQESKQIARSKEFGEDLFTLKRKESLAFLLICYFAGCLFGFFVTFWFTHR